MSTLTLRPDAVGYVDNWIPSAAVDNYTLVDEASHDSDSTYVYTDSASAVDDLYNISTDAALTGATITNVAVYATARYVSSGVGSDPAAPPLYLLVRVGSTTYAAAGSLTLGASYAEGSKNWAVNPADSADWEKADIDDLQIGIRCNKTTGGGTKTFTPRVTQVYAIITYTVSGTTYYQTVAGTVTPAGTALGAARKALAGALTSAGTLAGRANKILTGTLTSAGDLVKRTSKALAGAVTPAGVVAGIKIAMKAIEGTLGTSGTLVGAARKTLAGTLTSAGTLAGRANKILTGTLTSAGTVTRMARKALEGTLSTSGVVAGVKTALKALEGTLTPSGTLAGSARKVLDGTLTSAGSVVKQANKILAGVLDWAGDLVAEKIPAGGTLFYQAVEGTLTSAGELVKQIGKALAGALTSAGAWLGLHIGVIIDIDLETGDTSQFDSVVETGGDASATAAAALAETTYGLAITPTGAGGAIYGQKGVGTDYSTTNVLRWRFYIKRHTLNGETGWSAQVIKLYNSAGEIIAYVTMKTVGGLSVNATIMTDAGGYNTTHEGYILTYDQHCVEVKLIRATSSSSSDGSIEIWIDGSRYNEAITGIDNYDRFNNFSYAQLGIQTSTGMNGTLYLDELVINNTGTLIGLVPGAPVMYLTNTGQLTPAGVVATIKIALKALEGTLTSAGDVVKQAGKALDGTLSAAGDLLAVLSGKILQAVGGTISFAGGLVKQVNKSLAGTLTPAKILAAIRWILGGASGSDSATHLAVGSDEAIYQATSSDELLDSATGSDTNNP